MPEIWKPVTMEPFAGRYEVSNMGNVRAAPVPIPHRPNGDGYRQVTLRDPRGNKRTVGVHRLVASAFHGAPTTPDLDVNHADFDRSNNRPGNLSWSTRLANIQHSDEAGHRRPRRKIDAAEAVLMRNAGTTLRAIAEHFGCSVAAVHMTFKRRGL